jgi:hypothetical protein
VGLRSILAFLLSLGFSVLVTWAGIHFDNALLYVGIALIALVLILYAHGWAFPQPAPVQYVQAPQEPEPKDERERALQALRRARDNAQIALHSRSEDAAERAVHELKAAILSVQGQFGTPAFKFSGGSNYREVARFLVRYVDSFYPLLREGHISEAIKAASKFPT